MRRKSRSSIPGLESFQEVLQRHRTAEQEPLNVVAAVVAQHLQLRLVLDLFGHDAEVQIVSEGDQTLHESNTAAVSRQSGDEGAGNLDPVERKVLEMREGGELRAEIVEPQLESH